MMTDRNIIITRLTKVARLSYIKRWYRLQYYRAYLRSIKVKRDQHSASLATRLIITLFQIYL